MRTLLGFTLVQNLVALQRFLDFGSLVPQTVHTFCYKGLVVSGVLFDGFSVNPLSHYSAQLEVWKFLTTDLNGFAGLGITSRVRFILFHLEATKATNFNPSAFGKSISDAVKEEINADFRISQLHA